MRKMLTARERVAFLRVFLEFAYGDTVLVPLDLSRAGIRRCSFRSGRAHEAEPGLAARSLVKVMGDRVPYERFVDVGAVKHPVVTVREARRGISRAVSGAVAEFRRRSLSCRIGGSLPAGFYADIVERSFCGIAWAFSPSSSTRIVAVILGSSGIVCPFVRMKSKGKVIACGERSCP